MPKEPFAFRTISKGVEAKEVRTLVFDENYKMRPLLKGESVGDLPGSRYFQEVYRGDYIITTTKKDGATIPYLRVTRHRDAAMSGPFAVEVLNRINPILARYLTDYSI